jgi:hypothetical protein
MMVESEGEGSDVVDDVDDVDDVDCIRGYVCSLCPRVASGRLLSAYIARDHFSPAPSKAVRHVTVARKK